MLYFLTWLSIVSYKFLCFLHLSKKYKNCSGFRLYGIIHKITEPIRSNLDMYYAYVATDYFNFHNVTLLAFPLI